MEMVSTITSLITNVVNFAGGLLLLFGAVTLGTNLKDHNGPGISSGAWSIAGGVLIIAVATYFGTLFAAAGFLYLIYIIVSHFTSTGAPIGWASTTALLLLLGGMILVVLGIMGEYVGRIYMCANAAPQYVEREVIRHEGDNA